MANAFLDCIYEQMARKGFGQARADEVARRFNGLTKFYQQQGTVDPELRAMTQAFDELHFEIAEKSRRAKMSIVWRADAKDRIDNPVSRNRAVMGATNDDLDPGRQAISFIEHDEGAGGSNYYADRYIISRQLWAINNDVVKHAGKGAFGRQRGKANLDNIVRELLPPGANQKMNKINGGDTGDTAAHEMAVGFKKTVERATDMYIDAGGSMRKLSVNYFPQKQSSAKLINTKQPQWAADMENHLDWSKMSYDDGSPVLPADHARVLEYAFNTLTSGGVNKLDPSGFKGRKSVGNKLSQHRFFVYKDGDAWLAMHERYGNGNPFDVMASYIEMMASEIALLRTFGPNPPQGARTLEQIAIKKAQEMDADPNQGPPTRNALMQKRTWQQKTQENLKKFKEMTAHIMHDNPMDSDSPWVVATQSTVNTLVWSQMGSAIISNVVGDPFTTAVTRWANGMGIGLPITEYAHAIAGDKRMREFILNAGFVHDQAVTTQVAQQRLTGLNTYGPSVTGRISDGVLRASGFSANTAAGKQANRTEMMGMMARDAADGKDFADLRYSHVLARYGITPQDWDILRIVPPQSPRPGTRFLVPMDISQSHPEVFRRFQNFLYQESQHMIPDTTLEARMFLRGSLREDSMVGLMATSFSLYKGFPVTFAYTMGRIAMVSPGGRKGRWGLVAGGSMAFIMSGALIVQLKELAKGRDLLPMDTPQFWGKALLAGGGLSLLGDFFFSGFTEYGDTPEEAAAGPVWSRFREIRDFTMGLTSDVLEGTGLEISAWGATHDRKFETPARLVKLGYTLAPKVWWMKPVIERQVNDRLMEIADPLAPKKRRARAKQRKKDFGNESWWGEGDRIPKRAPRFDVTSP